MTARKALSTALSLFAFTLLWASAGSAEEMKADENPPLVMQGKGFSFSVLQPLGWQADEAAMKKYQASVAFTLPAAAGQEPGPTIVVIARRKVNENVALSLESDKQAYRERDASIEMEPVDIKHPSYVTYPQLFKKPGEFYVYTAYLNPKGFQPYFSVVLTKKKDPATPAEMTAYKEVLESIKVIPESGAGAE